MRSSTRGTLAVLALVIAGVFLVAGRNRNFTVYYAKPANAASTPKTATSTQPPSLPSTVMPAPTPAPTASDTMKKADDELGLGDINLDDISLDLDLTAPSVASPKKPAATSSTAQTTESAPSVATAGAVKPPTTAVKTPPANPDEDKALTEQAITGGAEAQWVADTTRQTSATELVMIEHATTGGVARTDGLLHLTGKKACPT